MGFFFASLTYYSNAISQLKSTYTNENFYSIWHERKDKRSRDGAGEILKTEVSALITSQLSLIQRKLKL